MQLNDNYGVVIAQLKLATHDISEHSTDGDISINMADLLMKDIERCLLYFQKNPKPRPTQTHDETSTFSHSGR